MRFAASGLRTTELGRRDGSRWRDGLAQRGDAAVSRMRACPRLVGAGPVPPMRRLDVELSGGRVDPFRAVSVAREHEGVDHAIDVENFL